MLSALGHVLPIAVAVALSTVPVTATLVILLSPRRSVTAVPFASGWVLGLILVSAGALLFGRALPPARGHGREPLVGLLELAVGGALVVLGALTFRRPRNRPTRSRRGWADRIGSLGPLACFGLGVALNVRPKGLLLGVAAGLAVASGARGPVEALGVLAVYVVISASTVVGPVGLTILAPARTLPVVEGTRDWLAANRTVVAGLIMLLIGVVVVGDGIARV